MTFINHAFTGAALMLALFPHVELSGLLFLIIYGAIAGSLPDTLDWLLWYLSSKEWMRWLFSKPLPRWGITYGWFHKTLQGHIISLVLIAPLPHVLADHLVHTPVLPRKGEHPFMDEKIIWGLSRHDIIWLTGETMLFFLGLLLLGVYIWLH